MVLDSEIQIGSKGEGQAFAEISAVAETPALVGLPTPVGVPGVVGPCAMPKLAADLGVPVYSGMPWPL